MPEKKQGMFVSTHRTSDPLALLRRMTSRLVRAFEGWPSFRRPSSGLFGTLETAAWSPKLDVVERDNRLVTRVSLPGMKKEDVSVEVTDDHLALSGERNETEEKKDNYYRFYRRVPLPEGVKLEDVKVTFADGVLEVSVPLPARPCSECAEGSDRRAEENAKSAA